MDLITQVQDKLDHLLHVFGTCIGVLQRDAPPSSFNTNNNNNNNITPQQQQQQQQPSQQITPDNWDVPANMALQVIETSQLIESYLERLPGFDKTENEQYEDLKNLNNQSKEISKEHQISKQEAIEVLKLVKESIRFISEESKKVDKDNNDDNNEEEQIKDKKDKENKEKENSDTIMEDSDKQNVQFSENV